LRISAGDGTDERQDPGDEEDHVERGGVGVEVRLVAAGERVDERWRTLGERLTVGDRRGRSLARGTRESIDGVAHMVLDERRHRRAERRRADGRAHLPEGVVDARRHARPAHVDDADRGRGERRIGDPDAEADQDEAREHHVPVRLPIHGSQRKHAYTDAREADADQQAGRHPRRQAPGERRDDEREERERQDPDTRLERREP
jgi:hypothetical protein